MALLFRRRTPIAVCVFAACASAFLVGALGAGAVGTTQTRASFRTGDTIADAIARHRRDRGVYPASLDALAPVYIAYVPATEVGAFAHRFAGNAWTICQRDKRATWRCDD